MGAINKLSAAKISKLTDRGLYGDGGGLWFQVSAFDTKSWVFRFTIAGKARGMGLGAYPLVSLAEARERAEAARKLAWQGIDPIEERRARLSASGAANAKQVTFARCVDEYLAAHSGAWRNAKHRDQWKSTLKTYAEPIIGHLPVTAIDTALILKILRQDNLWNEKPETASRLRGRIERVLAWATVSEYRQGDNPARWRGHLREMLPAKEKVRKVRHHKALSYAELPAFMLHLRANENISARALEFVILNASRTSEARGARWAEFDFDAMVWTIPGTRMKSGREHRVPLSDRGLEILAALPRHGGFVFPGAQSDRPLSNMALLELLRGMNGNGYTVHGFRSTFRDWAAERTNYPREIAESALAHVLQNKTEAAYLRTDVLEKRRALMRDWAKYCSSTPVTASGKVVALHDARV